MGGWKKISSGMWAGGLDRGEKTCIAPALKIRYT